jgi:hypothetical protein
MQGMRAIRAVPANQRWAAIDWRIVQVALAPDETGYARLLKTACVAG